jgi:hypothetical protein
MDVGTADGKPDRSVAEPTGLALNFEESLLTIDDQITARVLTKREVQVIACRE